MLATHLAVLLVCFIANSIATISGFGVSTLLTPTLLLFFPIKETILMVCIIHIFHDIGKLLFFYRYVDIPLTISFGIPALISSAGASFILTQWKTPNLSGVLGIFLLIYATMLFFNPSIRLNRNWQNMGISGAITGFVAGIFGIVGVVKSMFLISFDMEKKSFVGTSGLISFIMNITRLIVYVLGGITLNQDASLLPWLIAISILGTIAGRYLVRIIPAHIFERVVLLFIIAAAIRLITTLF